MGDNMRQVKYLGEPRCFTVTIPDDPTPREARVEYGLTAIMRGDGRVQFDGVSGNPGPETEPLSFGWHDVPGPWEVIE